MWAASPGARTSKDNYPPNKPGRGTKKIAALGMVERGSVVMAKVAQSLTAQGDRLYS